MLKVLVNAYACSPHTGSEPGMAWNWCVHLAEHCELYIITEGEFKHFIDEGLERLPQRKNMHFFYNPVSEKVRQMCWKQGDWRFYGHYKKWQHATYLLALDIIRDFEIDIIHQLNMIGFREPGCLWKINGISFVWGPIGGLKRFPLNYLKGADLKTRLFVRLKNVLNIWQLRHSKRVNLALRRADLLISSIPDSYRAIKRYKALESIIIPETGCFLRSIDANDRFEQEDFNVLWVGKFDFRKQLPLALKSIAATENKKITLHVYGKGTERQEREARKLASLLKIENQVSWHGLQPNAVVNKAMSEAQLFFFTSVSEDTSTVVLEAISNRLPVLCFDTCGFGHVVNEKVGVKVKLSNPEKSVLDFSEALNHLFDNPDELLELSLNSEERQRELSWDEKAKKMVGLYKNVIHQSKVKSLLS